MLGIDRFIQSHQHQKNIPTGILTNHATFSASGFPVALELVRQGFSIKKIFSPEHGVDSQGEDGKLQPDIRDNLTKLPVVSLYGNKLMPSEHDLKDIDVILIDLPNIGCRFYTFWWTITYMLEACALYNKKVIFLDRPNLSSRKSSAIEGPMLDEKNCSSFLGRWSMPLTYCYSYGQLAKWFVDVRKINISLETIPFDAEDQSKGNFIPPSPAINEPHSALIYPCTGLFEGVNINSGRGTTFPFRVIGAPWIDHIKLHRDFSDQEFSGITAYPYSYQPVWSNYGGEFCHGLYFNVDDADLFMPVQTGIWLINYFSVTYPNHLKEGTYPTAVNPEGINHLDLLLGIPNAFNSICGGSTMSMAEIKSLTNVSEWAKRADAFLNRP